MYQMARLIELQSNAKDSRVDIFFIDDPTDHNPSGWKRAFGDSAWFTESLPNRFPTARKYVFACQQQRIPSSSADIVQNAARSLLLQWAQLDIDTSRNTAVRRQSNTVHRPVLFVCQRLGGLVVQKALQLPESDGGNPALARRAFGTIFVGTPHPVTSSETKTETPNPINETCQSLRSQEATWFSESQLIQEPLALVGDAFCRANPVYKDISFCLGTTSNCSGAMEVHQSCLWSIVSQSQRSERERSHYVLSDSLDPFAARNVVEHSIACMSDAATRSLEYLYGCLESEEAMKEFYARDRAKATCEWLFSLEKYERWVMAEDAPLLWISGSRGTGKSTLCSAIIDSLRRHEQKCDRIAFSFVEDSLGRFDVAQSVLKTLTYQLLEHQQAESLGILAHATNTKELSRPIMREDFRRQLRRILASVEKQARVFLILDGLDCNEWIKEVIMAEVGEANLTRKGHTRFRCTIATQDLLEATLSHFCVTHLNLDVEPGVRRDLQKFTTGGLADVAAKYATQRESTTSLAARLECRANGVFLWAALALEVLDQMQNAGDLANAIESIPSTVDGIYQERLRAIPPQNVDTVQKIFSWLTVAIRPLRLSELTEALAVDTNLSHLPAHRAEAAVSVETQNPHRDIPHLCGNLVTIAETGAVRLRHPSLRKYLFFAKGPLGNPRSTILEAHELIARTCLVLLTSDSKKNASMFGFRSSSLGTAEALSSLTDYAAANWLLHYRLAETHSRLLPGTLHGCLSVMLNYACGYLNLSSGERSVQIAHTILRISASQGLVSLTRMCLEMGTNLEAGSCNKCKTPLALAAAGGHVEATHVLLQHAVSSVSPMPYDIEKLLHLAVASGLTDIAKTLLRDGAKVNTVDHDSGRNLLHNAAASGNWELVALLMDYNADVNAVDPTTLETPLHLGALNGHLQVVRYLVDGRDASAKELAAYDSIVKQPYYQSWTDELLSEDEKAGALIWEVGARDSAEEHLERLLSWSRRYADVNMRTVSALTAMDLAASKGHENVVRFLLERGAMLRKAKSAPCTALQAAVENGHMGTVKLLLAAGADMHQKFEKLGATLKHASKKGHDDVADLLVWHYFNTEIFGNESFQWPMLCVPTKSRHTVVRDSIQKTQGNTLRTKRASQPRSFPRISSTLAEMSKC